MQGLICRVARVFSKWLFGLCLDVITQISLKGPTILNTHDLEWSFQWGRWICVLSSQVCVKPAVVSAGHRCLGKFLTEGLSGLKSSCCFCDLVRFLVSQKPLFLGSCCCIQPCPVITGRQGGLRSVSRGVLRYRVSPRVSPQQQGACWGCSEAYSIPNHGLHLNFALAPDGDIPLSCSVWFVLNRPSLDSCDLGTW